MAEAAAGTTQAAGVDAARQQQQIIQRAMEEVTHIATLPEVTLKIIEVVEDPDSSANELHEIIANDPALSARILKVVNSAFYGLPGQIGSINRAIVLLGLNAVKNIAIAASLAKLFKGGRLHPSFSARDLWTYSIAVGAGVKLLAQRVRHNAPDEAFLSGLMHDIGIMVEMQTMRAKLTEAFDRVDQGGLSLVEAERSVIGVDHQAFGKALCEKWKFPRSFSFVCGFHHQPMHLEPDSRRLPALVHIAGVLAAQHGYGYPGVVRYREVDPEVLQDVGLTESQLQEVSQEIPEAYEVAEQLLG